MAGRGELATALLQVLVVGVVSVSLLPTTAFADRDIVARTCNSTEHPDQCRALLGRDPRSANATTVTALAGIAVDAAAAGARDVAGTMSGMSDDGRYGGTAEGEALTQCAQTYGDAAGDLDDARAALGSGEYADASRLVSDAEDAADACERAFSDRGVASVVSDLDRRMEEACGVVWNLIDLLLDVQARNA